MTVYKRDRGNFEGDLVVSLVPNHAQRDQTSSKRVCGTQLRPAPGVLTSREVVAFLSQLKRSFCAGDMDAALSGTALTEPVWQAFAELNLLMEQHWTQLSSAELLGYHSLVRTSRVELWRRFAVTHGMLADQLGARPGPHAPLHLQLVAFLLDNVLASYPDASLVKYTLKLPPWMADWAARWGWASPSIVILLLQAHPALPRDPSSSTAGLPARTLYVPMLP